MSYIQTITPALLQGAIISLELFALTLIFSLPLGLPIALGENSKLPPLRWFCKVYVLVFRGTPLMLQLFFFYYFFPICLNIRMDAFPTAVLTFALNYAAYFAEIYRVRHRFAPDVSHRDSADFQRGHRSGEGHGAGVGNCPGGYYESVQKHREQRWFADGIRNRGGHVSGILLPGDLPAGEIGKEDVPVRRKGGLEWHCWK